MNDNGDGECESAVIPKMLGAVVLCMILLWRLISPEAFGQEIFLKNGNEQYDDYSRKLDAAELLISEQQPVPMQSIGELESILRELEETGYTDLTVRCRMVLYVTKERSEAGEDTRRQQELSDLVVSVELAKKREQGLKRAGTITLGTALLSFGLFNLFWFLADSNYERYRDATTLGEAQRYQKITEQYEVLSYIFGAVGVVSLTVSIPLFVKRSSRQELRYLENY